MKFEAESAPYADSDCIRIITLDAIALFGKYRLNGSSGKGMENIGNDHVACLMYKLLNSSKDSDDLSIVPHRSNKVLDLQLTEFKRIKKTSMLDFLL